jgi:hypothetical protein
VNNIEAQTVDERHAAISKLAASLDAIEKDTRTYRSVDAAEIKRRRKMLEELRQTLEPRRVYGGGSFQRPEGYTREGPSGDVNPFSMVEFQKQQLAEQDVVIDAINAGVDRLHGRALDIKDESTLSVKLLDSIDTNVDRATMDLRSEIRRAVDIRRKSGNCPLYICIVVLIVVLVLLLVVSYS